MKNQVDLVSTVFHSEPLERYSRRKFIGLGLLISKNGINIFFGADTGYTEIIQQQLSGVQIDLAIMGIGAYSPKSFEAKHATPEQAWKMAEEISAKWIIPMHWGAFNLSKEPMEEPIVRFRQAASGNIEKVAIQETGATWILPR